MVDDSIDPPGARRRRHQPIEPTVPSPVLGSYDWLRSRREGRPAVAISSVTLLNELYDEPDS